MHVKHKLLRKGEVDVYSYMNPFRGNVKYNQQKTASRRYYIKYPELNVANNTKYWLNINKPQKEKVPKISMLKKQVCGKKMNTIFQEIASKFHNQLQWKIKSLNSKFNFEVETNIFFSKTLIHNFENMKILYNFFLGGGGDFFGGGGGLTV